MQAGELINIEEIHNRYIDNLNRLEDPDSQCGYLLALGMDMPKDQKIRENRFRLEGCRTAIWLRVEKRGRSVFFSGDSDSLLVKGVLSIYRELYNGRTSQEIQERPPEFLKAISDLVIYPEIKENGLLKCYRQLAAAQ